MLKFVIVTFRIWMLIRLQCTVNDVTAGKNKVVVWTSCALTIAHTHMQCRAAPCLTVGQHSEPIRASSNHLLIPSVHNAEDSEKTQSRKTTTAVNRRRDVCSDWSRRAVWDGCYWLRGPHLQNLFVCSKTQGWVDGGRGYEGGERGF